MFHSTRNDDEISPRGLLPLVEMTRGCGRNDKNISGRNDKGAKISPRTSFGRNDRNISSRNDRNISSRNDNIKCHTDRSAKHGVERILKVDGILLADSERSRNDN